MGPLSIVEVLVAWFARLECVALLMGEFFIKVSNRKVFPDVC